MTKPRKAVAGAMAKKLQKQGEIQRQIVRENQRHANAVAGLAAKQQAAAAIPDPVLRQLKLADLPSKQKEENDRHRDKIADLNRRSRDAVR